MRDSKQPKVSSTASDFQVPPTIPSTATPHYA